MMKSRIDLSQDDIPRKWYNILPNLPEPLPPYKNTLDGKEIRNLPEYFSKTASDLEFSSKQWIDIPNAVLNAYIHCGRPRPLIRAKKLEDFLKTPARIYYKCEDLPPGGTFKTNTALPQAYWAMNEGYKRTILGGSSRTRTKFIHVFAAKKFGLVPTVFSTRADCNRNPDMTFFLKMMLGADLIESPSIRTETGRKFLEMNPNHPGSMAIVRDEIAEEVRNSRDAVIVMSTLLNHVLLTQTIIGLEVEKQLESINEKPNRP